MTEFIKMFDDEDRIYIVCVEGPATDINFLHAIDLLPEYRPLDIRKISFNGDWTNIPLALKRTEMFEISSAGVIVNQHGSESMSAVDRAIKFRHTILTFASEYDTYRLESNYEILRP